MKKEELQVTFVEGNLVLIPVIKKEEEKTFLTPEQQTSVQEIVLKQITYCDIHYRGWRKKTYHPIESNSNGHTLIAQVAGSYLAGACDAPDEEAFLALFDQHWSPEECAYADSLFNQNIRIVNVTNDHQAA